MSQSVEVILVEGRPGEAMGLEQLLARHGEPVNVTRVDTAFALQAALHSKIPDIVISEYRLPLLSGLLALEIVRRYSPDLPFILVSASAGEDIAVEAMRLGASDYVMKGGIGRLLPAFQRELRATRARREFLGEREAQMRHRDRLTHYDTATGLANRILFEEELAHMILNDARSRFAVVVVQLDRYASIAGILGRQAGDELILQAALRFSGLPGAQARIARIEADCFAVVLPAPDKGCAAVHGLQRAISEAFASPFEVADSSYRLDPSMGIAIHDADGSTAQILLRNAEIAASEARAAGEVLVFHSDALTARAKQKLEMESHVRRGVERGEFSLHYQPRVNINDRSLAGVEALLRWTSPELGSIAPAQFIPLLEETGLIVEVGTWVLRTAMADHRRWCEQGLAAPRIAVNVSVKQLHRPDFVEVVTKAISAYDARPPIDLEITESLLIEHVEESIAKLGALSELGVGISIDDFGTGYSSLAYLATLPLKAVKIDLSFIHAMTVDAGKRKLLAAMIDLIHSLGLKAVAEGVETGEQLSGLMAMGCDEVQGFFTGVPAAWDATAALLAHPAAPVRREPAREAFAS